MLDTVLLIALVLLSIAMLICFIRIIKGPSTLDRVLALDSIGINLISMTAVVSIMLRSEAFVDIILLIGILSFIGTIAFSKFMERGVVFERKRDR